MRGQFKRGGGFEKESLVRTRMEDTSNFAQVGLVSLTCSTGLPWPVLYQRITAKPASVRRSSLFEKPTWSSILVLVVSLTSAAVAEKPTIMPNNLWHCGISPWFFQISQREILCHQTDPSPTEQANNLGGESKTCLVCTFFFFRIRTVWICSRLVPRAQYPSPFCRFIQLIFPTYNCHLQLCELKISLNLTKSSRLSRSFRP